MMIMQTVVWLHCDASYCIDVVVIPSVDQVIEHRLLQDGNTGEKRMITPAIV